MRKRIRIKKPAQSLADAIAAKERKILITVIRDGITHYVSPGEVRATDRVIG